MPDKRIGRVVGRSYKPDIRPVYNSANRQLLFPQLCIAELPNLLGSIGIKNTVIPEIPFQLKMSPMVKRISNRPWQHFGKTLKFNPIIGSAGYFILRSTVASYLPPLIMVPSEPYLRYVFKLPVFRYFLRIYMAMKICYRLIFGIAVVQTPRRFILQ